MKMETVLNFLSELDKNNNRDWFHAHKLEYQQATQEFEELVRLLMMGLREIDSALPLFEPKELTFKLMRDTRFSHDKSPYNPAFRAHISYRGKLPIPVGYYIMLKPNDRSFLGGGLFADMFKDATAMVRDAIVTHGDEWQKIITAPDFAQRFSVGGTTLKKVPNGYNPNHPQAEFLKNKSWYLEFPVGDKQLIRDGFLRLALDVFQKMLPFNTFLNRALDGFQMPTR